MQRPVTAASRALEPAERRDDIGDVIGVDPHRARAQLLRDAMSGGDIFRPDTCGETVGAVVGDANGIRCSAHLCDGQCRAEDFFLPDATGVVDAGEDGRFDVVPVGKPGWSHPCSAVHRDSLGAGQIGVAEHPIELNHAGDRADLGGFLERVAECQCTANSYYLGHHLVVHALINDQTAAAVAGLAGVVEDSPGDRRGAGGDVLDIREHNLR